MQNRRTRFVTGVVSGGGSAGPLLGRESALRTAGELVTALGEGRPGLLSVTGPLGVGRSAVLGRVAEAAAMSGAATAVARCSPVETDIPYSAVTQLLAALCTPARFAELVELCVRDSSETGSCTSPVHLVCAEFAALSRRGPLALALDDLQWADPWSLCWLEAMLHRVAGAPILIATTSHGSLGRYLGADAAFDAAWPVELQEVGLEPLSSAQTAAFLTNTTGEPVDEAFASAAMAATRGFPAVLARTLDRLQADGVPPVADRTPALVTAARAVWSESTCRVARGLPADAIALLQVFAVCGEDFDFELAVALARLSESSPAQALEILVTTGLAVPDPPRLAEPHLAGEVLAVMPANEREDLFVRAAALGRRTGVGSGAIADLLAAAPPVGRAWAGTALTDAAALRSRQGRSGPAVTALRRALGEPLGSEQRARVLTRLATLEVAQSPDASDTRLRQVLTAPPCTRSWPSVLEAADLLVGRGDNETARQVVSVMCERGAGIIPQPSLTTLGVIGWIAQEEGPAEPEVPVEPLAAPADPAADGDPAQAGALAWLLATRGQDRPRAGALAREALANPDDDGPLMPKLMAGRALLCCFEPAEALSGLDAVLSQARIRDNRAIAAQALLYRALAAGWLGRAEQARRDLYTAGRELPVRCWHPTLVARHVAGEMATYQQQGDVEKAREAEAAPLPAGAERGAGWAFLLYERGRLRLARGDVEGALTALLECGRILRGRHWLNPMLSRWRTIAAVAQLRLGDRAAAQELIAEEKALGEAWGASELLDWMREVSFAKLGAGAAIHPPAARPALRLPAPRDEDDTTGGLLSEPEREVVELAAGGMANRDIAKALSVATRTVELRLTKAYRKLGIRGRAQLAARWAPAGRGE
ncbi:AAA family ATPase [Amycolatopsis sp. NPDC047767]|uniref:AAA family ATPase n=1 Tax=Amycolatopsis sp. NPDC047767 TaxID=3156765 RepID=UPI0034543712